MLRLGGHFVAAGHFLDGHAVFRAVEFRHQAFQQRADALRVLVEGSGDLGGHQGLLGYVHAGFQYRHELRVRQHGGPRRFLHARLARFQPFLDGDSLWRRVRGLLAGFRGAALRL